MAIESNPNVPSPNVQVTHSDLSEVKQKINQQDKTADVIVKYEGRSYKITFYDVNEQNFEEKVNKAGIASMMATAVLHKVDTGKTITFKSDGLVVDGKEKNYSDTNPTKERKYERLEYLNDVLNHAETIGGAGIRSRFENNQLNPLDYSHLRNNGFDKLEVDRHISSKVLPKMDQRIALLKKANAVYLQIIGPSVQRPPHQQATQTRTATISAVPEPGEAHQAPKEVQDPLDRIRELIAKENLDDNEKKEIRSLYADLDLTQIDALSDHEDFINELFSNH